ncbi:SDR family NAD(P)-dependent oxidoreductase [Phenylobacterium sp. SCN 70-31]|uniref:SDR family NAD(P)-dependent oxidoreductase n=1 Tax=Phenylobacterium sp. SCN 70-31 TaxID=1660129 RepID=UPI00086BCC26|nr:SDR family NAD(P)-dependent oxidoreductase [Phenylobacterium sp. SCN 70-31]ODT87363.1 MAG: 3-(cis-5,6-dihydroxycyclohexa-1,3-dien-1-yl)propanoate dehydrogenase [Phenylobacterium sp. SCN 70-31]
MTGWLTDQVAIVTGASAGIGRAVVDRYIAEGARGVVAVDRDAAGLEALSAAHGDRLRVVVGDVREWATHEAAVTAARTAYGRLDAAVGNAGVFDFHRPLAKYTPESLVSAMDELFAINVRGYLLLALAAREALAESRGSLVYTASVASQEAGGGGVLYVSSKHAVLGVIRRLAMEFAPDIRVNGVGPGGTLTQLRGTESLGQAQRSLGADREASAARIAPTNPLRLAQEPEDHAGLYVLLASRRDSRAMTGQVLYSDGGVGVRPIAAF